MGEGRMSLVYITSRNGNGIYTSPLEDDQKFMGVFKGEGSSIHSRTFSGLLWL